MNLQILMSCMHLQNFEIINNSKITSDVLIINQSDENLDQSRTFSDKFGKTFNVRMISTTERGLSRSRNLALKYASGDICLISDDDQEFEKSYEVSIINAFEENPKADIIIFSVNNPRKKKFSNKKSRVGYLSALRFSSSQIAFRRARVLQKRLMFDVKMGSGTGNGGGEETKFLYDCLKHGLRIYYVPILIATLTHSSSMWFSGFTNKYFMDKGWAHKRTKGYVFGIISILRFVIIKYPIYRKEISFNKAVFYGLKGIFVNR